MCANEARLTTMIFRETKIGGAYLIQPEKLEDPRGHFARTFCEHEFAERGLETRIAQCSVSFSRKRGTLRGMHYQAAPFEEAKLVRCTRGAIFDVIIDLRRDSASYKSHLAVELNERDGVMLYVPAGVAHGFQTLAEDTEVFYQMSQMYSAAHARGVRWNDPAFHIAWPAEDRTILERDQSYPDFMD